MNSTDAILPSRRSFARNDLLATAIFTPTRADTNWNLAYGSAKVVESDPSAITTTSTPTQTMIL